MNTRDKFAMAAMQALIGRDGKVLVLGGDDESAKEEADVYADAAYVFADAMLKRSTKW